MRMLLLLLLIVPAAFAAWQGVAAVAIVTSVAVLGVLYMVGTGLGANELQVVAKEELFQVIAVLLMVVLLTGTDSMLNYVSGIFVNSTAASLQEAALDSIDDNLNEVQLVMSTVADYDKNVAVQGSKASSCSILGMGYSVSGCGSYTMLATPLSMAGGITGFAIGELFTMKRLIQLSQEFSLNFILPLGIVLRTLKLTRGAGGLLIALGVSLHIMLPLGVVFNESMGATFLDPAESLSTPYRGTASGVSLDCNAGDTDEDNENDAIDGYNTMRANIRKFLYDLMIRATLGPVISLLMFAASLRALTSLAGAEVDVSAVSRFV
ncbi:MAG: hypothetical protein AB1529_03670 [Candidatus Micrarchaeota archaeon]